jgi:uncharacterized membrane protein YGL010W
MSRVDRLLGDYAYYHQTRGNIVCHAIGIPLITYALLALLLPLPLKASAFTGCEVLIVLSFFYYLTLDYRLGLSMLLVASLFDVLARYVHQTPVAIGAFIVGWIFQGIGHSVYEKKSPAFFRNLIHLLISPIFLVNELFHFRPVSLASKTQIPPRV